MISIEELRDCWGWGFERGIQEILKTNIFGNILVRSEYSVYRIVPEDCRIQYLCNVDDFAMKITEVDFIESWEMKNWEIPIIEHLGAIPKRKVIAFKIPRVLGGKDDISNIYYANPKDYIGGMGQIASQIKDLPDGANVQLKVE